MNISTKYELGNDMVEWRLPNGELHREDGPAIIAFGEEHWYFNGKNHRVNGPAVTLSNGTRYWYQYGRFHREDGPAIMYSDGDVEYWIEGDEYDPVTFLIKRYEYINKI